MIQDIELFIAIAEIAGVFVGFGALISLTRRNEIEASQLGRLRAVVSIGLVVVVAALIPVGVSRYGVTDHTLWLMCSLIFLGLLWAMSILSLRQPENRKLVTNQAREGPVRSVFFWILLEAPIHVSLILIATGVYPDHEPALYLTALLLHLFEAAYILAQLVHTQAEADPNAPPREHHALVH